MSIEEKPKTDPPKKKKRCIPFIMVEGEEEPENLYLIAAVVLLGNN